MFSTFIGMAIATVLAGEGLEVTVYNQGYGLVKEVRTLKLRTGVQQVPVEDVAQMIEANSVGIRSVSSPGSFTVLEQNYQYDLISPIAILNKAVGREITLTRVLPDGKTERITGTLLSSPTAVVSGAGGSNMTYNGMVLRTNDGRILLDPWGTVEVTSIPEGLISRPTLMWELDSETAGDNTVELSYMTGGLSWNADYVLSLDKEGKLGDLKGWVTMNNQSGKSFKQAKLKLLAGEVHRAPAGRAGGMPANAPMEAMKRMDAGFAEEQFSEYHLYTLGRPADIRNRETKQLSLLEAVGVNVRKKLVIDAMRNYQGWRANEGEVGTGQMKPVVLIELKNSKDNKMGMPLPAGNFKIFQRDSGGSLQMIGEDAIDHTPRDEKLALDIGRSFDIVAERKRSAFEYIRNARGAVVGARESFKIELRNRKESAEQVTVLERYWGEWKVTQSNHKHERLTAEVIQFVVDLKPNEVRTIEYTVENRW